MSLRHPLSCLSPWQTSLANLLVKDRRTGQRSFKCKLWTLDRICIMRSRLHISCSLNLLSGQLYSKLCKQIINLPHSVAPNQFPVCCTTEPCFDWDLVWIRYLRGEIRSIEESLKLWHTLLNKPHYCLKTHKVILHLFPMQSFFLFLFPWKAQLTWSTHNNMITSAI